MFDTVPTVAFVAAIVLLVAVPLLLANYGLYKLGQYIGRKEYASNRTDGWE